MSEMPEKQELEGPERSTARGPDRAITTDSLLLSFREPPQNSPPSEDGFVGLHPPQLLPPLGHRTILGEVRAFRALSNTNPTLMDSNDPPKLERVIVSKRTLGVQPREGVSTQNSSGGPISKSRKKGVTITKGAKTSKGGGVDQLTWLTTVRVGDMRGENSSGISLEERGSGSRSLSRSRDVSRVRSPTSFDNPVSPDVPRSASVMGAPREEPIDAQQRLQNEYVWTCALN